MLFSVRLLFVHVVAKAHSELAPREACAARALPAQTCRSGRNGVSSSLLQLRTDRQRSRVRLVPSTDAEAITPRSAPSQYFQSLQSVQNLQLSKYYGRVKQSFEYMTERTADLANRVRGFTRSKQPDFSGWTEAQLWRVGIFGLFACVALVGCGCACAYWCLAYSDEERDHGIRANIMRLHAQEIAIEGKLATLRRTRESLEDEAFSKESPEEMRTDMQGLNAAVDRYVETNTAVAASKFLSFWHRRELVEALCQRKFEEENARVQAQLDDSAASFGAELRALLDIRDEDILRLTDDRGPGSARQLPPLALVLAGLAAPFQLVWLVVLNRVFALWHFVLFTFDVSVLLNFPNLAQCSAESRLTISWEAGWLSVHGILHLIMFGGRMWALACTYNTYRRIASRVGKAGFAGRWLGTYSTLFQTNVDNPRALYMCDYVLGGVPYWVASFFLLVDFFWNACASLSLWQDHARCSAIPWDVFLFAIRVYSTMFSVFFFANVFLIAAWVVLTMLQRPAVSVRVLRRLRSWDEQFFPAGLPVLSLALRTFVLRDAADRWQAEHTFVSLERKCVEEEETTLRARLAAVAQDREALSREEAKIRRTTAELRETEDEFVEAWFEGLNTAFGTTAEPGTGDSLKTMLRRTQQDAKESLRQAQDADLAGEYPKGHVDRPPSRSGFYGSAESPFFLVAERGSPQADASHRASTVSRSPILGSQAPGSRFASPTDPASSPRSGGSPPAQGG
jgi:hypothetical protein